MQFILVEVFSFNPLNIFPHHVSTQTPNNSPLKTLHRNLSLRQLYQWIRKDLGFIIGVKEKLSTWEGKFY
jgi:hypothetical protein